MKKRQIINLKSKKKTKKRYWWFALFQRIFIIPLNSDSYWMNFMNVQKARIDPFLIVLVHLHLFPRMHVNSH